ncbi:zinc finger BED domain-containing protein 4-like [Aplochiton taeniatus]
MTWFSSGSGTMPLFSGNAGSSVPLPSGSGALLSHSDTGTAAFNPLRASAVGLASSLDYEAGQNATAVSARQRELDDALLSMLAKDSQPLSLVEDEGFSAFVRLLDPDYSLPSKLSLKERLSAQCDVVQETMLLEVEKADFISLSSEVWMSVDGLPLVSVTGHLVTESSQLQTFLLGISRLQEDHKDVNLEETRNQLVAALGLHSKVVALVTDREPCSSMAGRLQKLGTLELPSLAGVLNQAVLGAMEATAELQEIRVQARTIVKYFRSDPVARDRLSVAQRQLNCTQGQKLLLERENRWNTVYVMLECLFNQRQAVAAALSTLETDILPLGSSGYEVIHQCLAVLKPFHQANAELCSEKRVSASKVIPLVHMLTVILEEQRQSLGFVRSSAATLSSQLQRALQASFSTVETEPVLALATLLDPRFKVLGFGCQASAQEAVKLLTSECAAHIVSAATGPIVSDNSSDEAALSSSAAAVSANSPSTTATAVSAPNSSSRSKGDGSEGLWERFDSVVGETQSVQSSAADAAVEVQRYLSDAYLLRGDNPIGYWERHSKVYPHLFPLARKYLGVPASAVPCQRLQSKAGDVFKRKRSCLGMKTVEKILILNDGLL